MQPSIWTILQKKYSLSNNELNVLIPYFEQFNIKKKAVFLTENQMDHYVYFIEKGIVQSTILREGREFTVFFALEHELALSSPHLTIVAPSHYTLEALEDCVLWRISRTTIHQLFSESIPLANWGRKLVEDQFEVSTTYFSSIYWMSKKQQYHYVLEKSPELVERLSLKNLAAWLDITPQSLSRIRAGLD